MKTTLKTIFVCTILLSISYCSYTPHYITTIYKNLTASDVVITIYQYNDNDQAYTIKEDVISLHAGEEVPITVGYIQNIEYEFVAHWFHQDSIVVEKDGKYLYCTPTNRTMPRSFFEEDNYLQLAKKGGTIAYFNFYEEDFVNAVAVGE